MNNRPARSTPTTAPLSSRVKKPRWPRKPPLVIALPDLTATDWRTAATSMATDLHAMLTRHPWLVQAFGFFLLVSPGKARHDDHTLAIYEAAGFTDARADQAATTVFTFVLGDALGSAAAAWLTRKLSRDGGNRS